MLTAFIIGSEMVHRKRGVALQGWMMVRCPAWGLKRGSGEVKMWDGCELTFPGPCTLQPRFVY